MTILFLFDFGFSFSILVTRVFLNSLDTNLVDMSIYQFWVWYVPESRKIFSKFLSSDQEKGFYHLHASFIFRKYKWHCHNFRGFFFPAQEGKLYYPVTCGNYVYYLYVSQDSVYTQILCVYSKFSSFSYWLHVRFSYDLATKIRCFNMNM